MIRKADRDELDILAGLAIQMWSNHTIRELAEEFSDLMDREDATFFIKYESGDPVGFAQCQLRRDYVEGTETSPVGYLEGIFVMEKFRHRGYAKELLNQCEKWAKSKGCKEFASDCELDNTTSLKFHLGAGFTEVNRIICFSKKL